MLPEMGSISFFDTACSLDRLGQTTTNLDDSKLRRYITAWYATELYQNRTRQDHIEPHRCGTGPHINSPSHYGT